MLGASLALAIAGNAEQKDASAAEVGMMTRRLLCLFRRVSNLDKVVFKFSKLSLGIQ